MKVDFDTEVDRRNTDSIKWEFVQSDDNPAELVHTNQFFGEEKILNVVREHRARPLKEIASTVLNEGMSFSGVTQPEDDLTLFMLRFR